MFSYDWGLSGSCHSMRPTSSPQRGFSHRRRFRLTLVHPSNKGWWLRPDFAFLQLLSNSWCEFTFTRRGGEIVDCTHPRYLGKVKYLLTWSAFLHRRRGQSRGQCRTAAPTPGFDAGPLQGRLQEALLPLFP